MCDRRGERADVIVSRGGAVSDAIATSMQSYTDLDASRMLGAGGCLSAPSHGPRDGIYLRGAPA